MNDDIKNWTDEQLVDGWSEADERAKAIYQRKKAIEEEMQSRYKRKIEKGMKSLQIK